MNNKIRFMLSNDLCSLNPNEDKLVIACIMEFNQNAELVQSEITEGVIKKLLKKFIKVKTDDPRKMELNELKSKVENAKKIYQENLKNGTIKIDTKNLEIKLLNTVAPFSSVE